jgi:hypothetical protein
MQRWVGLGVIADNLLNIGRAQQKQTRRYLAINIAPQNHPSLGGFCCVTAFDRLPHVPHFCAGK